MGARVTALDDQRADVVIGSRYVAGGDTGDWPAYRRGMSWAAGTATRRATGLRQRDLSGGYKLWPASALRAIDVASTGAQGYGFQIETTMRAHRAGLRIVEEPIRFGVRTAAYRTSKLSGDVVWEGARLLVELRRATPGRHGPDVSHGGSQRPRGGYTRPRPYQARAGQRERALGRAEPGVEVGLQRRAPVLRQPHAERPGRADAGS